MSRQVRIVVSVVDNTKRPLEQVERGVRKVGKATQDATIDITKFNRGLFGATAVAATFTAIFLRLGRKMQEGIDFERLTNQFERVMGPRGKFLDSIKQLTDVTIDKTEALQSALSLGNLGIVRDSEKMAAIIAKAGVAAKMAGKDSGEGVRAITEFLKTGNVSQLQNIDLLNEGNVNYRIQQAILGKVGGSLGGVIALQHRYSLGMQLLNVQTKGQLKGFADLKDIYSSLGQELKLLRAESGALLAKALTPLARGLTRLIENTTKFFEQISKDKDIQTFTKSILALVGGVTAAIGVFAVLKGSIFALTALGFGVPKLTISILALAGAFGTLAAPMEGIQNKLKLLGAIFRGVFELVGSYDPETGLSLMSKDLHQLLTKHGLLGFVQVVGRVVTFTQRMVEDIVSLFKFLGKQVDAVLSVVNLSVGKFFDAINQPWSNWLLSDQLTSTEKAARTLLGTLTAIAAIFTAIKGFKFLGGILSRIPVIGGMFGGKGPKGTASDPIYTRDVSAIGKVAQSILPTIGGARIFDLIKSYVGMAIKTITSVIGLGGKLLFGALVAGAGKILTGLGALLLSPLFIKAALAGGIGYLGYRLYKYFTDEKPQAEEKQIEVGEQVRMPQSTTGETTKTANPFSTPLPGIAAGNKTSIIQPDLKEMAAIDKLGESLMNTRSSNAISMQNSIEKMLDSGMKPSEVASEKLGTKLDDANFFLEAIVRNTDINKSLLGNPMGVRPKR
jgi:hypothetical protein